MKVDQAKPAWLGGLPQPAEHSAGRAGAGLAPQPPPGGSGWGRATQRSPQPDMVAYSVWLPWHAPSLFPQHFHILSTAFPHFIHALAFFGITRTRISLFPHANITRIFQLRHANNTCISLLPYKTIKNFPKIFPRIFPYNPKTFSKQLKFFSKNFSKFFPFWQPKKIFGSQKFFLFGSGFFSNLSFQRTFSYYFSDFFITIWQI